MFETKEFNQECHDALWKRWGKSPRGTVVALTEIESVIGITVADNRFRSILNRFRNRVFYERDIRIWSLEAGTVKFLTPREQAIVLPEKRRRRIYRQAGRAKRESLAINPAELSNDSDRRARVAYIDQLKLIRRQISRARNVIKKTETIPVRRSVPA